MGYAQAAQPVIDPAIVPSALSEAVNSGDSIKFQKFFASVSADEAEKWMSVLMTKKTPGHVIPASTEGLDLVRTNALFPLLISFHSCSQLCSFFYDNHI